MPPEGNQDYLPSLIFYFLFLVVAGGEFWVTRYPDTLTKCLKVRWAESRQLFRSLVVKAFAMAAYAVITNWLL